MFSSLKQRLVLYTDNILTIPLRDLRSGCDLTWIYIQINTKKEQHEYYNIQSSEVIKKKMKWQNYPYHHDVSSRLHLPREQDAFDWRYTELKAGGVS